MRLLGTWAKLFDGTAPAQTRAHRSDGKCHRGFAYTTCCSPQPLVARQCQGRGFWIVYCLRTADKALDTNIVVFSFLRDLQENQRADERTRTAYPCSLRVRFKEFAGVHCGSQTRINKEISHRTHAAELSRISLHWCTTGVPTTRSDDQTTRLAHFHPISRSRRQAPKGAAEHVPRLDGGGSKDRAPRFDRKMRRPRPYRWGNLLK